MPYVKQVKRPDLDLIAAQIPETLSPGELNYLITKICDNHVSNFSKTQKVTYEALGGIIMTLECVKLEFYARVMRLYEGFKTAENGDVYTLLKRLNDENPLLESSLGTCEHRDNANPQQEI